VGVTDSRVRRGTRHRRRVCNSCGYRWTTIEVPIADLKKIDRLFAAMEVANKAMVGAGGVFDELREWLQDE
jgi:hypothetical protein